MGQLGQLDTASFNQLLANFGETPLAWYRYVGKCPRSHQGSLRGWSADAGCAVCGGTGAVWRTMSLPTSGATEGKMVFQQARVQRTATPLPIETGDIQCTYSPTDYPLGEGDRIVLGSRESNWSERLIRGSGPTDRLFHPHATSILEVYDEDGRVTSGYSLYMDGAHISWSGGPAAGEVYTVLYRYHTSYQVLKGSFRHRVEATNGDKFPSTVILRLWEPGAMNAQEDQL